MMPTHISILTLVISLFYFQNLAVATAVKKCFVSEELSKKSTVSFTIDGHSATGTWTNEYDTDGIAQKRESFPFTAEVITQKKDTLLYVLFLNTPYHMPILWTLTSHESKENLSIEFYSKNYTTRTYKTIRATLNPCRKLQ